MAPANKKKGGTAASGKENQKPASSKENVKATSNKAFAENPFAAIEKMDGNPMTPQEFDEYEHGEEEFYFRADDDAPENLKRRCLILNYIHTRLHVDMQRTIPAMLPSKGEFEYYHRDEFQGVELDVCVWFPKKFETTDWKQVHAVVKYASDQLEDDDAYERVIGADVAWTPEGRNDPFTMKHDSMSRSYWAPRWKYLCRYLTDRMWNDFEKDGTVIEREHEPENVGRGGGGNGAAATSNGGGAAEYDDGSEQEEVMEVFSGITGRIIGPGGSKIKEIKAETSIANIDLPKREDGAPRPRPREMVNITLKGTRTAINKVKVIIKEISDEWNNTPRPPRDGGGGYNGGGGGNSGGYDNYTAPPDTYVAKGGEVDVAPTGNWGGNEPVGSSSSNWADSMEEPVAGGDNGGGSSW
ncbi:uncharacterized protein PAC_12895 [Phialocephala subalpina]|uniref:K Homology domain-containing protein n=1 Tax=Phialocephala subalpina TaxID=576137 RepID=A0A1L7XDB2_9HELO|nr:uncharacterized protein PAC_12895 [Phialocephala subalpina]